MVEGTAHELVSFSDAEDTFYPWAIAYSQDYKEVLFSLGDDIYYFSIERASEEGFEAQYIGNVSGGYLIPLNQMIIGTDIFSYEDTIHNWRSLNYPDYSQRHGRTQKSVQNNVYCLLKEQNGTYSASLVRLTGTQFTELVPNITGNISLSADETKLWCVADGRLVFCDLAAEFPRAVYCGTAYVRAYGESGMIGVSGESRDGWPLLTVPIAATSDGSRAYFIDTDGILWMCTPQTINNPTPITNDAFWVQCSADDEFYLITGRYFHGEYDTNGYGDLYLVGTDGSLTYQYNRVADVYTTKTDVYILVNGDFMEYTYALYRKSGNEYSLCSQYSSEPGIRKLYWCEG